MSRTIPLWLRIGAVIGGLVRPFRRRPAILVVKLDSLGDALLFTGALRKLREHFKDHEIVVACSERAYPIYEKLSPIDRIVVIDPSDTSIQGRLIRIRSAAALHALSPSLLLHPVYSTSAVAHVLCEKLRAGSKVWFKGDASYGENMVEDPGVIYDVLVECEREVHELDKSVALLKAIGVPVSSRADIRPDLELTASEKAKAKSVVAPFREQHPGALVMALCAGARFKMKDWGIDKFTELISRLAEHRPLAVLLLGSATERFAFEDMRQKITKQLITEDPQQQSEALHQSKARCRTRARCVARREDREEQRETLGSSTLAARRLPLTAVNLAGSLSIRETTAVIAESDLCVGNDTFGLHAAVMVDTPSVVIMGGGDFPRWAPWGDPSRHRTANKPMDCYGCGWQCKYPQYRCIEEVTVQHVIDCAQGLRQRGADEFSRGDAEAQRRREILLPTNHPAVNAGQARIFTNLQDWGGIES